MSPEPVSDKMAPDDIIIAVMGITGSGKTTFISRCMGEDVGIGHGLESCTQDVAIHSFRRRGRVIRLIDTPGFDDTSKSDVNILNNIAFWLSHAYRAEPKLLLSGIVYLHPVSDTRMGGTATTNLEMMKRLCGEHSLSAVWLATTMWRLVPAVKGAAREQELMSRDQFWGGLIHHGSSVLRHYDSEESAFAIIDRIIAKHQLVALRIQREMVEEQKTVEETDAGRYLRRNVLREQEKFRDRLDRSARELDEMLAAQEAGDIENLLERQRGYQQKLDEKDKSLRSMRLDMERLKKQKAEEFAQREKDFAREKEMQDAKMQDLGKQVRQLQEQRESAIKQAEAAAASRSILDDANFQLMLQRDISAIKDIGLAIAERKAEEERAFRDQQSVVKQESIFRKTMKVSMAESLVHGALHLAGHAAAAMCVVM